MIGTSLFIGKQIELTALNPEKDSEALSGWSADQEFVKEFMGGDYRPYSASELKKAISEKIKKADERASAYYFAIRPIGKDEIVGVLVFGWLWSSQQTGRLFLFFEDENALKQFGEEALNLGLRYGFMELSLHRLWTELSEHNTVKLEIFEKIGFLREVQRREGLFFDGKYYDQLDYAMLKPEWKHLQQEVKNEK
jgi:RimJ/RimL family protein N-acetyltransferase